MVEPKLFGNLKIALANSMKASIVYEWLIVVLIKPSVALILSSISQALNENGWCTEP